jgi:hypothetical protein
MLVMMNRCYYVGGFSQVLNLLFLKAGHFFSKDFKLSFS